MCELFDETAARVLLAIDPGESIRQVAQHLHTPYETVRQAVNRLEAAGYLVYDDGLLVTDEHVRETALTLLTTSGGVSPPSIEEAYVLPQFGDWPFAFARIDAVYVWTQGGYQVGRDPDDYPLFLAVREQDVEAWQGFFEQFGLPTAFERQPRDGLDGPLQIVLDLRPTVYNIQLSLLIALLDSYEGSLASDTYQEYIETAGELLRKPVLMIQLALKDHDRPVVETGALNTRPAALALEP
ncbi:helix-turn-helix domain-containing protein [Haloplanus aerogenes]|uniref:Uncharacterized protein n=1 Tax=Haloplanus aerogenes TaxID=660522 RepID=A0A3M0CQ00_9EURY|nr:helix-turn-helix domain-containing protein [Haloplanus aerogenes]RMB11644.1 hypothetical protein ATH50_3341 [Haloplanus aerogenes]